MLRRRVVLPAIALRLQLRPPIYSSKSTKIQSILQHYRISHTVYTEQLVLSQLGGPQRVDIIRLTRSMNRLLLHLRCQARGYINHHKQKLDS